jgi:cytidine deaminase
MIPLPEEGAATGVAAPAPDSADALAFVDTTEALELVFGLVGPTGVDLDLVCDSLRAELRSMHYETQVIALSELIEAYLNYSPGYANYYEKTRTRMEMGTFLKEETKQPDILARLALARIRSSRRRRQSGTEGTTDVGVAYIIRSFKVPAEVDFFRDLYGEQFVLISVYGSKESRIDFLKRKIGPTLKSNEADVQELAHGLIRRDYEEEGFKNGQQVGKTFPLADFFVNAESRPDLERSLRRLVRLTFGHPYLSPTKDEQAMFFAQAAGLRSLDLSRQVGAAVVSLEGEVLSTGCNDVPKAGGGLYWAEDANPKRDFEVGFDANVVLKRHVLEDVLNRLQIGRWLNAEQSQKPIGELVEEALKDADADEQSPNLKRSSFYDVIEFGRAVHAEMAAISQAARLGVSIQNARLFCTTFPCHICARHIVAAGIKEVVFIEPYEKSRVQSLYSDSIAIEPMSACDGKVPFRAFVGVAPRRYIEFFQSRGSKKLSDGSAFDSEKIGKYKIFKKKTFHISLLEAFLVKETKPAPKYPKEKPT